MPRNSLLDDYLKKMVPGYREGALSAETVAFAAALDCLARKLPDVAASTLDELRDQRKKLKLIASENFASPSVLLAMGSWLTPSNVVEAAQKRVADLLAKYRLYPEIALE